MRGNRTLRFLTAYISKLPQLSSKEKKVLMLRLKTTTLKNIGLKYNVTEGRIRQIEKGAILKVKSKFFQQKLFKV